MRTQIRFATVNVPLEISQGKRLFALLVVEKTAFQIEGRIPWFEAQAEAESGNPAGRVTHALIGHTEVDEHALEDLATGDGGEEGVDAGEVGGVPLKAALKVLAGELLPGVEGVEEEAVVAPAADEEVAREADAIALQADALGNLHVDEREGDGDAETALDDAVDVAILGIGVVLAVTAIAERLEELGGDGAGQLAGTGTLGVALTDGLGDEVELTGKGVRVYVVTSEAGDGNGAAEEVDLVVVSSDRLAKIALGGVLHREVRIGVVETTDQRACADKAQSGTHR